MMDAEIMAGQPGAIATASSGLTADELCDRYAEQVFRFATMVAGSDLEAEMASHRGLRALRRTLLEAER